MVPTRHTFIQPALFPSRIHSKVHFQSSFVLTLRKAMRLNLANEIQTQVREATSYLAINSLTASVLSLLIL